MLALTMLLWGIGQADTPATAAGTLQQRFDRASEAAIAGRCAEAVAAFDAIAETPAAKRSALVSNAIAVRKGRCLARTGRIEEARPLIEQGLRYLATQGPNFAQDRYDGNKMLGMIAEDQLDYAEAISRFRSALQDANGTERIAPLIRLASMTMFDPGDEALGYAAEALRIAGESPEIDRKEMALVEAIHARVLLNKGRAKEAYTEMRKALAKRGGLTMRVSIEDISTRGDLALAALLNGDQDAARQYLAYTGAGRTSDAFATASNLEFPLCNTEDGLKPDDLAIVEFNLSDQGLPTLVTPIYAKGGRAVAIAFADAVQQWSWQPEDVAKLEPFFRTAIRVELRCSRQGERPSLLEPAHTELARWGASIDAPVPDMEKLGDVRELAKAQAAVSGGTDGPPLLPALTWLTWSSLVPLSQRADYADRALRIASADGAATRLPTAVLMLIRIGQVQPDGTNRSVSRYHAALRSLLAEPAMQGDPLASATLRQLAAAPVQGKKREPDAEVLLTQVAADARLPQNHPLRVAALLQLADIQAARGDLAQASASFAQTGLTEQQCALIGLSPVMTRGPGGSSNYPSQALRMGFEGWTKVELDIDAAGKPFGTRTVAAYPPFVFTEASQELIAGVRYQASYRPDSGVACSAHSRSIVFRIPD